MAKTHTHTRKPEPVKAWQHLPLAELPDWAEANGIHEEMLGRWIDDKLDRAIPHDCWLVLNERRGMVVVMTPEQFAAEYDEA
jgi:hypothetical protein